MNFYKSITSVLIILTIVTCKEIEPSGSLSQKDFSLESFTALDLSGSFHAVWVESDKTFISIETYPNILNNLNFSVENSTLYIKEKRPVSHLTDFYRITIYSPQNLKKIKISNSVNFNISGKLISNQLEMIFKNKSQFIGAIQTKKSQVMMSETSRANFSGKTQQANIKISDTANIIAPYWQIKTLDLESKNNTYTEIQVLDTLKGKIEDKAKLIYYQQPVQAMKISKNTQVYAKKLQ